MRADIDRLMEQRGLDALVVVGLDHVGVLRAYMSNGAHVTGGYIVKKRGGSPIMIVNGMETEEAAKSGLEVLTYYDLDWVELMNAAEGNPDKATIAFWAKMLERAGVTEGTIGIYGEGHLHEYISLVGDLREHYPQYRFVGERGRTLFDEAFMTKDADEILRIRSVAARTSEVLRQTWDFIASHRAEGEIVVDAEGSPLTIGAVKRFVRRALLDLDLEDTDMIFAQGRDAGFPHSRGEPDDVLRVGESIVFDLFPHEIGGGYYHDCTRTWSINYAKPEVQQAYDQVMNAFEIAVDNFQPNIPARALQEAVQSYLEQNGHPTGRSKPGTMEGYVHSLGHGLGLEIHERPSIGHLSHDTLTIGNVISIEPGLYYPEQGFGVRVEDTFVIDERGVLVSLTDFQKDLVLPLRG